MNLLHTRLKCCENQDISGTSRLVVRCNLDRRSTLETGDTTNCDMIREVLQKVPKDAELRNVVGTDSCSELVHKRMIFDSLFYCAWNAQLQRSR